MIFGVDHNNIIKTKAFFLFWTVIHQSKNHYIDHDEYTI